jgi:hypothetical protein
VIDAGLSLACAEAFEDRAKGEGFSGAPFSDYREDMLVGHIETDVLARAILRESSQLHPFFRRTTI